MAVRDIWLTSTDEPAKFLLGSTRTSDLAGGRNQVRKLASINFVI
jgi:hypothetical protein